ncbi:hypothetical protein [Paenibacillus protaetiae]|uniref:Uncharacterized protein n=1 Tax=Paenibacillus protaetiae TaxID=2509456 RepID=A0A4P6F9W3_9BACL|nr:hypothetical protein [Paenibacillus protaetiae]QAY67278.1 hypothetical protein ET464_13590 [Paenibacillus protaetiae]
MSLSDKHALQELALRYAPLLHFDRLEPFTLIRAGITVFEASAPSPSFNRLITVNRDKVRMVIEYALYWDYDIQHTYDLEHVWVYIGHDGAVVSCEASFHGRYLLGILRDRSNVADDRHVSLFVQPGKHALSPLAELFRLLPNAESCCLEEAGVDGVLEPALFEGEFNTAAGIDQLAEAHLRSFGFKPSFHYVPYEWNPAVFVSWDELRMEIPVRMRTLLASLA